MGVILFHCKAKIWIFSKLTTDFQIESTLRYTGAVSVCGYGSVNSKPAHSHHIPASTGHFEGYMSSMVQPGGEYQSYFNFTSTTSFNNAKNVAKSTLYTQSRARGVSIYLHYSDNEQYTCTADLRFLNVASFNEIKSLVPRVGHLQQFLPTQWDLCINLLAPSWDISSLPKNGKMTYTQQMPGQVRGSGWAQ